jgi:hypothetical protein
MLKHLPHIRIEPIVEHVLNVIVFVSHPRLSLEMLSRPMTLFNPQSGHVRDILSTSPIKCRISPSSLH